MNQRKVCSWNQTWMELAHTIAKRSKDPSTQCGAVVVYNKDLLGMGYNGPPERVDDSQIDWADRSQKYPVVFHSESNALWKAAEAHGFDSLIGGVLYVTGRPCHRCVLECVRACLNCVVYDDTEKGNQPIMVDEEEWKKVLWISKLSSLNLIAYSTLMKGNNG